jgi:tetratricopeptide (TPR) repeat protein
MSTGQHAEAGTIDSPGEGLETSREDSMLSGAQPAASAVGTRSRATWWLGFGLSLFTFLLYWPTTNHEFVALDDPTYLLKNTHAQAGLTWSGVVWAFTTGYGSNWHPLTWLSHMLDCQLFGLNPGPHHLVSVLLHVLNTVLLFLVLKGLTGAQWRSALVAALFAWHPLHVESVAWAAERKDVLSTLFFLLTIGAYARYAILGGCGTRSRSSLPGESSSPLPLSLPSQTPGTLTRARGWGYYGLALVLFAFGLMAKPMLVTLPCVLLLLDFWPLRRFSGARTSVRSDVQPMSTPANRRVPVIRTLLRTEIRAPLVEKLPFFALSLGASIVTYFVQKAGGAVSNLTMVPFSARVANALVAYARYLEKTVWPHDLSVFYPLPAHWPVAAVAGSALLLVCVSVLCVRAAGTRPYLLVGWLWFLGTLVPTIGLVQVGSQSMADRYMYIPSIGLFIIAAWGLAELRPACAQRPWLIPASAAAALVAFAASTSLQLLYWKNEQTLFRHALACTTDNYLAYDHLAKVCESAGQNAQALDYYEHLLTLKPRYPEGQYNMGTLLMNLGRFDEAGPHLRAAVAARPGFAQAHCNLGLVCFRQKNLDDAAQELDTAVRLNPADADARLNLGIVLLALNRPAAAVEAFEMVSRLQPKTPEPQFLLALALSRDRKPAEASAQAQRARDLAEAAGEPELAAKAQALMAEVRSQKSEGRSQKSEGSSQR